MSRPPRSSTRSKTSLPAVPAPLLQAPVAEKTKAPARRGGKKPAAEILAEGLSQVARRKPARNEAR
ncbi:MAG TPA: hypothetical protein VK447_00925, partial [Myxococcaceae bacterium]|nr:hypothetical protein [Myxococcaceae bacterium]